MAAGSKRKLRMATVVYWVLLLYIIAALFWWSVSLLRQNHQIHELRRFGLQSSATDYNSQLQQIARQEQRGVYKYVGEGTAFLLLISVGAVFIYRSVRRQFRLQQQQQNFVMAVTHELKTPIAVARLNLQTVQKHQLDEERRGKLIQTTLQETQRLDTLINNILISSQLEGNNYSVAREDLDFSGLVSDGIREFASRYPQRQLMIEIEDDTDVTGDATLLKLLLSNLLENANKYAPANTAIEIVLAGSNGIIELRITDKGCGIPDEEKKAVFEKFYRIGNEQTRTTQGTGLGLYICKKIVADHGGTITLKNSEPTGSTFIVQLPAHD